MAGKAALGKQHVCFGPLWIGAQNTFPPNMLYVGMPYYVPPCVRPSGAVNFPSNGICWHGGGL